MLLFDSITLQMIFLPRSIIAVSEIPANLFVMTWVKMFHQAQLGTSSTSVAPHNLCTSENTHRHHIEIDSANM